MSGNVTYRTRDLEESHIADDGTLRAKWETDKLIQDPGEHDRGVKARSKARSLVTAICSESTFGLLCPEADRERLTDAIAEARTIATLFNDNASITRLSINVIVGRVAADDVEAVRAINGEVRDLMDAMDRGLQRLDVGAIREAANKVRELSAMLSPEAASRAQMAIEAARSAARQIAKAGETAAIEVDARALRMVRESRLAFLDMEEAAEMQQPSLFARPVDLEVETEAYVPAASVATAAQLEF